MMHGHMTVKNVGSLAEDAIISDPSIKRANCDTRSLGTWTVYAHKF